MAQPKFQALVFSDLDIRDGLSDWDGNRADVERSHYQHSTKPLVVRMYIANDEEGETIVNTEIVPKNSNRRRKCVLEMELPRKCNFGRREYDAFVQAHWKDMSRIQQLATAHSLPIHVNNLV